MKYILLSFSFFFSIAFPTAIIQHNNFSAILDYIHPHDHPHTLILLDIDNTIAQPQGTYLASDQWVNYHIKQKMNEGLSARDAWLAIKDLYVFLQHQLDLILIEEITAAIIKELQSKGIMVIAITARLPEISDRTLMQLNNIGIQLSSLWHEELLGEENLFYHYKDGIIFCDGNDKGKVFEHISKRINKYFKKIIAVDDREKNLHSIKNVLPASIEFVGIRYGYLDTIIENFDNKQAELDLQKFLILST